MHGTSRDRGDVDDASRFRLAQVRDRQLAQQEGAAQVERNRAVPFVEGHVFDGGEATVAAGAVDDDVESAEGGHRAFHRVIHRVGIGDVGLDCLGASAGIGDRSSHLAGVGHVDVDDGDCRALFGKCTSGFRAYALRGAADQRNAPGQFWIDGHVMNLLVMFSACTAAVDPGAAAHQCGAGPENRGNTR